MLVHAAEGKGGGRLAEAVDDAVTGDVIGVGIDVQSVADDAAPARVARQHGDLTVGRDPAVGDPSYNVVDQFKGIFHDHFSYFKLMIWLS